MGCAFSTRPPVDTCPSWAKTVPDVRQIPDFIPNVTDGLVVKVYDGDTITIAAQASGGTGEGNLYRFSVRIRGIDCPEIRGKTDLEKIAAKRSRDALERLISGKMVVLTEVGTDKYGRLLAHVSCKGCDIGRWMLDSKLARPYHGGRRGGWS